MSRAGPAPIAGDAIVGDEHTGVDDDFVIQHQRRARKTPAGDLGADVGCHVVRPHDGSVVSVERVQDSSRTERVYPTIAEGWRRARTGTTIRLPESRRVAVSPHGLAGSHVVTGDDLFVTALLLSVEEVTADREGR